jgi:hypothetical protein
VPDFFYFYKVKREPTTRLMYYNVGEENLLRGRRDARYRAENRGQEKKKFTYYKAGIEDREKERVCVTRLGPATRKKGAYYRLYLLQGR